MIMREILFRGKRYMDGEWVDGSLFIDEKKEKHEILVGYVNYRIGWEVDPATIDQYTGLKDKNGKKIFEGDIVKTHYANTKKNDFLEQVVFHNGKFCSVFELSGGGKMFANLADGVLHLSQDKLPYMEWCEIIGNIHDNPELLKGKKNE